MGSVSRGTIEKSGMIKYGIDVKGLPNFPLFSYNFVCDSDFRLNASEIMQLGFGDNYIVLMYIVKEIYVFKMRHQVYQMKKFLLFLKILIYEIPISIRSRESYM